VRRAGKAVRRITDLKDSMGDGGSLHSGSPVLLGTLYIVATPIGNLEDMTFRAIRVLREADLIAAEDTRHTRKLLTHFGISKPLTSYFDHNANFKGSLILRRLESGDTVALVTDAGTPCISDPGYQLVRDAVAAGIPVVPVPGACAAVTALSVSGLPTDSFSFFGFLPPKKGKRVETLQRLVREPRLLVFYEAPQRLSGTLKEMAEVLGDRQAVVCRELTKLYEEKTRGTLTEVAAHYSGTKVKGELVIIVAPPEEDGEKEIDIETLLRQCRSEGLSVRDAAKTASEATGVARTEAYRAALEVYSNVDEKTG
jgi:16S rRNA (cytidine1402-2'-O)-methyltransferase